MWQRIRRLISRMWQEHASPSRLGLAVAAGVVLGCSPFYGLHLWIGLGLCFLFRLNKVAVFLGSQISIPPFAPLITYSCVQLGSLVIQGQTMELSAADLSALRLPDLLGQFFIYWLVGCPIVGTALGLPLGLLTYWAARRRQDRLRGTEQGAADDRWEGLLRRLDQRFAAAPRGQRHYVHFKAHMDPVYRQVCELLAGTERVVDLGCGQGVLVILLALGRGGGGGKGGQGQGQGQGLVGVEWDAAKIAAGGVAAEGLGVELIEADVRSFELPSADAVVLVDVLHYYPVAQQRELLERAASALAPGGRLVLRETDREQRSWLTRTLELIAVKVRWNRGPGLCFRAAAELRAELERLDMSCQEHEAASSVHQGNVLIWGTKAGG